MQQQITYPIGQYLIIFSHSSVNWTRFIKHELVFILQLDLKESCSSINVVYLESPAAPTLSI